MLAWNQHVFIMGSKNSSAHRAQSLLPSLLFEWDQQIAVI